MGSIDGEIPAVWFLITSVGFIILSSIQYKNHGKSIETIFLSILAILFLISYFILVFKAWLSPIFTTIAINFKNQLKGDTALKSYLLRY